MRFVISENRMIDLVGKLVKIVEPNFTEEKAKVATYTDGDDTFLKYYEPRSNYRTHTFARYYIWKKELVLSHELFHKLEKYLDDNKMTYFIDWFNLEFDQDAETMTF